MIDCCCKDCDNRTVRCHIDCPLYIDYVKRNNEAREKEREEKAKNQYNDYSRLRIMKAISAKTLKRRNNSYFSYNTDDIND